MYFTDQTKVFTWGRGPFEELENTGNDDSLSAPTYNKFSPDGTHQYMIMRLRSCLTWVVSSLPPSSHDKRGAVVRPCLFLWRPCQQTSASLHWLLALLLSTLQLSLVYLPVQVLYSCCIPLSHSVIIPIIDWTGLSIQMCGKFLCGAEMTRISWAPWALAAVIEMPTPNLLNARCNPLQLEWGTHFWITDTSSKLRVEVIIQLALLVGWWKHCRLRVVLCLPNGFCVLFQMASYTLGEGITLGNWDTAMIWAYWRE